MHENERYGLKRFHAQMLLRRKPVGQLSEESVLLDLDLLPSVVSSEGLEKAQEELLTALEGEGRAGLQGGGPAAGELGAAAGAGEAEPGAAGPGGIQ